MSENEMVTEAEISDDVVEEVVETAEETEEVVEAAETEETTAETEVETDEVDEPPKVDPSQRKIAELAFKERELKRTNARLMKMLESQAEKTKAAIAPPKIEDFETFEEFLDARDSYKAESIVKAPVEDNVEMAEFELSRDELYANGVEKHPDFVEVVGASNVDITLPMANAIVEIDSVDLQVDTAYYLGSNPKDAARIAKLSPVKQIAEVIKISTKIESRKTKTKKPSKAPAPVKPISKGKTSSDEIKEVEDFESFMKKRNKQLGRA